METEKEQVFVIGGGNSFKNRERMLSYYQNLDIDPVWDTKSWKEWLIWSLEDQYEFVKLKMPFPDNADYEVWKIVFQKYLTKLNSKDLKIVAHSLGTAFILKFLLENKFPKKIEELHLVAPIVSQEFQNENDPEDLATFVFDLKLLTNLQNSCEKIILWHSEDDQACSIKNSEFIKQNIRDVEFVKFTNKGHFHQSTFLELFDHLRK